MPKDDPFDSARQLRMRQLFGSLSESRNPYSPLSEQGKLHRRVEDIQKRQQAHFERHAPTWRQKELNQLLVKHRGQLEPKLTPKYVLSTETSPEALSRQAWTNVEQRIQQRQKRLLEISNRMQLRAGEKDAISLKNNNKLDI